MRKLIAKITGWPLVSFDFGDTEFHRFAKGIETGEYFVNVCGRRIAVIKNNSYHDFKPVMNCRKHGVPLFKDETE